MRSEVAILAVCSALAVGACTPQQQDDSFAIACTAVPLADAGFQLYAASGKVSQSVIDIERSAVVGAQAVCNGPRPADVKSSIAAISRALSAIASATARARVEATGA